jgi:hypothetical protein
MTRDDILRMAREADPGFDVAPQHAESLVGMEAIKRFAALVADAEREACARLCMASDLIDMPDKYERAAINKCAEAIRARGKE